MSTRSRAFSKSSIEISLAPRRTACSAASFTRFARSAPLMPGVPRATVVEVDVGAHPLVLRVDLQDREALVEVGERDHDLAVEAARAQQRGVEDVGAVRRADHDDALGGVEAVHLREHLVERLLALVVAAAEAGTALAADRVDLVHEDDRRRLLARGLEQVAHAARADADEHLHEVRAARPRGTARRPRRRPPVRAASCRCPGGPMSRTPFGILAPMSRNRVGRLEEVDDLGDLLLHPQVARDVREGRGRAVLAEELGLASARST